MTELRGEQGSEMTLLPGEGQPLWVPTPGLWPDIPDSVYFADTTALTASGAKVLLGKKPPTGGPAPLELGTAFHQRLLGGDAEFQTVKTQTTYTKEAETIRASGAVPLTTANVEQLDRMEEAVRSHKTAGQLMDWLTERELVIVAEHESGALTKGKIDGLGGSFCLDLKTTSATNLDEFAQHIIRYGYHISMAHYRSLLRAHDIHATDMLLVVVEKTEPFRVAVVFLTEEVLKRGQDLFDIACERWLKNDRQVALPTWPDEPVNLDFPKWEF